MDCIKKRRIHKIPTPKSIVRAVANYAQFILSSEQFTAIGPDSFYPELWYAQTYLYGGEGEEQ